MIDLWERPVEVANWLDLILSVQHEHTAQKNLPALPLYPDVGYAPSGPYLIGERMSRTMA